jgi:hypothetical protein
VSGAAIAGHESVKRVSLVDLPVLAALALPALAAALLGSSREPTITINLGPGDGPYIEGFVPEYEVDEGIGTHWSTYDASVALPVRIQGPFDVVYRFARILPQTAQVDVVIAGRVIDRFTCRGGQYLERRATVDLPQRTPAKVSFHVDSHDRRNMGLKIDWVRFEPRPGGVVRLTGTAVPRAAGLLLLIYVILRAASWTPRGAAFVVVPAAGAATAGLLLHPWLLHRLLTGLPEATAVFGAAGVLLGSWLRARGKASAEDVRHVTALALVGFVARAAAVSHPDFYYPDLMLHARLVEMLRDVGPRFLLTPAAYLAEHGGWSKPAYGGTSGLPYSPAFHGLFAFLPFGYDATLSVFKLAAAAFTTVPLVVVWTLARRLGAPPLGAALMLLVPTYTSRLSFALLPALFGHAADMLLVLWIAYNLGRLHERRTFLTGALIVGACQLAYVSSVMNASLFVGLLAVCLSLSGGEARRQGAWLLAIGLLGATLAVLVFYRDFLGTAWHLVERIQGRGLQGTSRYEVESWWMLAYARTRDFFRGIYPLLATAGLVLLVRRDRERARPLLLAWLLTYALLLLLRAKVPDVFRYGHETLFFTPFVCLTAGVALAALWRHGHAGKATAAGVLAALAVQGLVMQWQAVAAQLGNAR